MDERSFFSERFVNLANILQSPVIELQISDPFKAEVIAKNKLERVGHCSIVVSRYGKSNRLPEILLLRKKAKLLKKLDKALSQEDSRVTTAFMGVYPSLDQPICVYELDTIADSYITKNILPVDHQWVRRVAKYLVGRFIGINPATEGIALILFRK